MNEHLEKARDYIARGDEFYAKAAEEMIASREEGITWPAIARAVGRQISWCQTLVRNYKCGFDHAPFGGPRQAAAE